MEIIAIESKAFATLVEKIEGIAAYVEASGTKEREQWPVADKKGTRKAGLWMTGKEVCEQLEISPRTLQRYRTNRIIAYSICGRTGASVSRKCHSNTTATERSTDNTRHKRLVMQ